MALHINIQLLKSGKNIFPCEQISSLKQRIGVTPQRLLGRLVCGRLFTTSKNVTGSQQNMFQII